MNVFAVLMAGGVGTRFWPRSREKMPKQVLNIVGDDTMIQATMNRLGGLVDAERVLIVTNPDQKKVISEQLPQLTGSSYVLEPFGRNTAPCIGLAALHVAAQDPDGVMVVLPADHLITKVDVFQSVLRTAIDFAASQDVLVTLGITPNEPATGYGYIQAGETVRTVNGHAVHKVKTFAEKPNLETATRFLESGDFFWNSGMFIWRASTILNEIRDKLPDIHERLTEVREVLGTAEYDTALTEMYRAIRGVSIDVGVMQQADNVHVIPIDMGWNDVGSWETVYDISEKDRNGNAGEVDELVSIGGRDCYVYSPEKVVALVGVSDLIVVDTGDALLVCHKSEAQQVKDAVEKLQKKGLSAHL